MDRLWALVSVRRTHAPTALILFATRGKGCVQTSVKTALLDNISKPEDIRTRPALHVDLGSMALHRTPSVNTAAQDGINLLSERSFHLLAFCAHKVNMARYHEHHA